MMSPAPKLVILNNEVMPYRIPLFRALARRGHLAPTLIYSGERSWERRWALEAYKLDYPHLILSGWAVKLPKPRAVFYDGEWRTIWINPGLWAALWRIQPQAIIAYEYSLAALTALFYAKVRACAYLTWSEMTPHTSRHLSLGQKLSRRLILSQTQAALGTSRAACDYFILQGLRPEQVFLAMQTLDIDRFRDIQPSHEPVILYVGFLNQRKGVVHLLSAFRQVLAQMPAARLVLAGEGEQSAHLQSLAQEWGLGEAVEFVGFVEPPALPALYARAQIFVLPSLEDTFAVVALEALAAGLSLICSPYAGVASHLEHGRQALIIPPDDPTALAQGILSLLSDADLRQDFQMASQALLSQAHPEAVAAQFEQAAFFALEAS
jgi:glycosyltransferase involved in cell wall biosynthesis